jgi:hypothetical protein
MIRSIWKLPFIIIACLWTDSAGAHPHVWVTMSSELIYAADGSVTGIRATPGPSMTRFPYMRRRA